MKQKHRRISGGEILGPPGLFIVANCKDNKLHRFFQRQRKRCKKRNEKISSVRTKKYTHVVEERL